MEFLFQPEIWTSLLLLTILEIVLGIDNIVLISILAARVPKHDQASVRFIGISLALGVRVVMLLALVWLSHLTEPLFTLFDREISLRDIIMLSGGLFLLYKGAGEIHHEIESMEENTEPKPAGKMAIIGQIILMDIVFSLDSIITAIGLAQKVPVMVAAVVIAMIVMLVFAGTISDFIHRHRSIKMLALSFLLLIGVSLLAEGMHFPIPKGYLYFAIGFSGLVETLNIMVANKRKKAKA